MTERTYHHGDLRRALLEAAESELEENGLEAFSLRKVARRAGVSHAAPAHHFGSTGGLLTALATVGFRRFVEIQKECQKTFPDDPRNQLVASGVGYVDFADRHNALFRLIFSSMRVDEGDDDLEQASFAAFDKLVQEVRAITGALAYEDQAAMVDAYAVWGIAHGLADLLSSGRMQTLGELPVSQRTAVISGIISRALPEIS